MTRLILNEKDKYNRPIPKRIWFSHLPDLYAEYICEDIFDTEIETGTYTIKAKLVIPAGSFYTLEDITTNSTGYIQGVTGTQPVIVIKPTNKQINITETQSKQKFTINLPTIDTADTSYIEAPVYNTGTIHINTQTQQTTWTDNTGTTININKYLDYNNDWFHLKNEYEFQTTGAILQTITYPERW